MAGKGYSLFVHLFNQEKEGRILVEGDTVKHLKSLRMISGKITISLFIQC